MDWESVGNGMAVIGWLCALGFTIGGVFAITKKLR